MLICLFVCLFWANKHRNRSTYIIGVTWDVLQVRKLVLTYRLLYKSPMNKPFSFDFFTLMYLSRSNETIFQFDLLLFLSVLRVAHFFECLMQTKQTKWEKELNKRWTESSFESTSPHIARVECIIVSISVINQLLTLQFLFYSNLHNHGDRIPTTICREICAIAQIEEFHEITSTLLAGKNSEKKKGFRHSELMLNRSFTWKML